MAELMAYIPPLLWYSSIGDNKRFRNVHIITDSMYVKNLGDASSSPKANSAIWAMFRDFKRGGLILHWHWMERESTDLNRFADALSKTARLAIKNGSVVGTAQAKLGFGPQDRNL